MLGLGRHRTTAAGLALGLLTALTVSTGAGSAMAARADDDAPPVTHPDHALLRGGSDVQVNVIKNDTDADHDDLVICRMAKSSYKRVFAFADDKSVVVFAPPRVSGTFTFTYYACDYDVLVPGTLTVTVKPTAKLDVHRILDKPGYMKVTNPNDVKAVILYGSFKNPAPDGKTQVPAGATVLVRVHRQLIGWVGYLFKSGADAGRGYVKHIQLPANDPGPPPQPVGGKHAAMLARWQG